MTEAFRFAVLILLVLSPGQTLAQGWEGASADAAADPGFVTRAVEEVGRYPVRDIAKDKRTRRLMQHPVYVSLTSSPTRLQHLHHVLNTLDLEHVDGILLTLPERYGRDGSRYEIPEALLRHPKLKILRIPQDLGPITKMLPAVEHVRALDRRGVVISIDDDVAYPKGMVSEMLYQLAHSRRTVVAGAAPPVDRYGITGETWPRGNRDSRALAEGFAGIAYRVADVDTERLRKLSQLSASTRFSDDLVINYVLAQDGVERRVIRNDYYGIHRIKPLPHGFQTDALHKGAGLTVAPTAGDYNNVKYGEALDQLRRESPASWRRRAKSLGSRHRRGRRPHRTKR